MSEIRPQAIHSLSTNDVMVFNAKPSEHVNISQPPVSEVELLPPEEWRIEPCGPDHILISTHAFRGTVHWRKIPLEPPVFERNGGVETHTVEYTSLTGEAGNLSFTRPAQSAAPSASRKAKL